MAVAVHTAGRGRRQPHLGAVGTVEDGGSDHGDNGANQLTDPLHGCRRERGATAVGSRRLRCANQQPPAYSEDGTEGHGPLPKTAEMYLPRAFLFEYSDMSTEVRG